MKKSSRRLLSIVMAIIMMLSTMFAGSVFAASKPGKVKVTSVGINAAKKTIKLKWKKVKGAKGYVIYKNTKKKFKKVKGVTVKKTQKTFKKLKVGKTYYFKIKAYKLSGKRKVYGKATVKKVLFVKKVITSDPTTNAPILTTQPTNVGQNSTTAQVATDAQTTTAQQTTAEQTTTTTTKKATTASQTTTKVTTTAAPTTVPSNLTPVVVWKDGQCWTSKNDFTVKDGALFFDSTSAFSGNQYQVGTWNEGSFKTSEFGAGAEGADGFVAAIKLDSAKALSGGDPAKLDVALKLTVKDAGTYIASFSGIYVGGDAVQATFPMSNFAKDGDTSSKITRAQLQSITNIELTVNSYDSFYGNNFTSLVGCYSPIYTYTGTPGAITLPGEKPVTPGTTTQKQTTSPNPQVGTTPAVGEYDSLLAMSKKTVGDTMTSPITNDKYTLKFIDDFTGTSLNTSNWSYYTRNYNAAEESVNRKENVVVQNGMLNIFGKKENQQYTGSAESWETPKKSYFTGGAINSEGKKTFKYGRLEIYCRIPYSYGMWPAFWTMGTQRGWPWGGEIDIMEFVGGVDQWNNYRDDEYHCGLHWADPNTSSNDAWGGAGHLTANFGRNFEIANGPSQGAKLHDKWRVCGLEWNDKKMYTYCDNVIIGEIDITQYSMREAFHQNHYIILNLVMGGSWAGTPNEAKGTVFPQNFQVDWVKVWQK